MKPKIKLIYMFPYIFVKCLRARRIAKKIRKYQDEKRYSMQWRNDYVLKAVKKILKFLNIKIEVIGYENIPKIISLMIANHSSIIDPMVILAALENKEVAANANNFLSVFLGKQELKKNKKILGFLNILNTFYIDRKNPRTALTILNEITDHAKENKKHIVIFPEGTRSKDGNIQDFKSGAFRIAKKAFIPIIPITINYAKYAFDLNRSKKIKVQVIFHPQIKPLSIIYMHHKDIAIKVKSIIASHLKLPLKNFSATKGKII